MNPGRTLIATVIMNGLVLSAAGPVPQSCFHNVPNFNYFSAEAIVQPLIHFPDEAHRDRILRIEAQGLLGGTPEEDSLDLEDRNSRSSSSETSLFRHWSQFYLWALEWRRRIEEGSPPDEPVFILILGCGSIEPISFGLVSLAIAKDYSDLWREGIFSVPLRILGVDRKPEIVNSGRQMLAGPPPFLKRVDHDANLILKMLRNAPLMETVFGHRLMHELENSDQLDSLAAFQTSMQNLIPELASQKWVRYEVKNFMHPEVLALLRKVHVLAINSAMYQLSEERESLLIHSLATMSPGAILFSTNNFKILDSQLIQGLFEIETAPLPPSMLRHRHILLRRTTKAMSPQSDRVAA